MAASFRALIVTIAMLAAMASAYAVQPGEMLADPGQEARARSLSAGLRCLVCQNQSIDESDADLAKDLRLLVRERITAGDTDGEVLDYIVSRYGEFVLLKPRFTAQTAALWLAPGLLLLGFAIYIAFTLRSRRKRVPVTMSEPEREEVKQILRQRDR